MSERKLQALYEQSNRLQQLLERATPARREELQAELELIRRRIARLERTSTPPKDGT